MTKREWQEMHGSSYSTNYVLEGDGFYISYNPDFSGFSHWVSDDGSDETALCKDGKYFILNGDFRDRYEEIIDQGFEACFDFYTKQNNVSSWSDRDARMA